MFTNDPSMEPAGIRDDEYTRRLSEIRSQMDATAAQEAAKRAAALQADRDDATAARVAAEAARVAAEADVEGSLERIADEARYRMCGQHQIVRPLESMLCHDVATLARAVLTLMAERQR
jgi:hypothetical protein